jgi:hypothetical protein
MVGKPPRFTENFSANLSAVEEFLGPHSRTTFRHFLGQLFDEAIPTLCRFPQSGRSFLTRVVKSTKTEVLAKQLIKLLNKEDALREFVMDEYLLLYLVRRNQVILLAVKHHRQLSFDLTRFWCEE